MHLLTLGLIVLLLGLASLAKSQQAPCDAFPAGSLSRLECERTQQRLDKAQRERKEKEGGPRCRPARWPAAVCTWTRTACGPTPTSLLEWMSPRIAYRSTRSSIPVGPRFGHLITMRSWLLASHPQRGLWTTVTSSPCVGRECRPDFTSFGSWGCRNMARTLAQNLGG